MTRFAVFAMARGPEAPAVAEADTWTGAQLAVVTMASEGSPGWYAVVDRAARGAGGQKVEAYYAPPGITLDRLYPRPPHWPWLEAARRDAGEVAA